MIMVSDYQFKNEKEFQSQLIKELKEWWYRVYKFPDIWYTLKPFDLIAVKDWKPIAIELKYWRVDTYEKIYKMLRPNQVGWLLHFQQHWGISLVMWRDKKTNKEYSYPFKYMEYEWVL